MKRVALTIAGSDPSGGAGIQADLRTFDQCGVYGMSVVTLLTVQSTQALEQVCVLDGQFVADQLAAVLRDMSCQAVKTGALGDARVVRAIADHLARVEAPLVVDPVFLSHDGAQLLDAAGQKVLRSELLPMATLVMPNLDEASALSGISVNDVASMEEAAQQIAALGPAAVLVTGGHLPGDPIDVLYCDGRIQTFAARRIGTLDQHGTGCTYSAAVTAELAKGNELVDAIALAKDLMTKVIEKGPAMAQAGRQS